MTFATIWKTPQESWTFEALEATQVAGSGGTQHEVSPNSAYLTGVLRSMRIPLSRRGTTRLFGAVHCFASVLDMRSGESELHSVTTPSKLQELDPERMDRVEIGQQRLFGPVPYRGGDVRIEIGLYSVAAANLAGPYLTLLSAMSKMPGMAFLGAAEPLVSAIREGMSLLSKEATLEIGLKNTFSPEADLGCLRTGTFVLARAPENTLVKAQLSVNETGDLLAGGKPVGKDIPYLVFSLERQSVRPDWFNIPELRKTYHDLDAAVSAQAALDRITERVHAFKVAALLSPDLLPQDAKRVVEEIESRVRALVPSVATSRRDDVRRTMPPLKSLDLFGTSTS